MLPYHYKLVRAGGATIALLALAAVSTGPANATMSWTDWTSAVVSSTAGSATGTLLVGVTPVTVTYAGDVEGPTQTSGGTAYWATNSSIYTDIPDGVDTPPTPNTDIISLNGGGTQVNTITFSQPVTDPVMAILSLGAPGAGRTYNFTGGVDFAVLNSGSGFFGGGTPSLFRDAPGVLRGVEGHGVIGFTGTFTSISWTVPTGEFWHGFTIGVRGLGTAAPEPGSLGLAATVLLAAAGTVLRRRKA